jgi:kumamolisin
MELGARLPEQRTYLSREEFAAQRGADPEDLAKIDAFAHAHNLTVVHTSIPQRSVRLAGTVADLSAAFGSTLKQYKLGKRVFRGRTGSVSVPAEIADIVVGVFGLDNRPAARPHVRFLDAMRKGARTGAARKAGAGKKGKASAKGASPRNAPDGSFTPPQVARLYNFPAGFDGTGQCIALIELNDFDSKGRITGTGFSATDLAAYFKKLKIKAPKVTAVGVDGGANKPGPDPNADGEVMLDIEVAGAVAPGANIAVYFAPNTDQGFIDAVAAALHDTVRKPSVISISWGGPEDTWTQQSLNAFNQVLQDAATLGVTVCVAAGDDGSSDLPLTDGQGLPIRDKKPHTDFPSASPFALACGGTKLIGSTAIQSEVVWNEGDQGGAGGGGVSNFFALPTYQAHAHVPKSPKGKSGRGVPDVAGDADPATGYQVRVHGHQTVIGGTSAVAPLWAGLLALVNQRLTKAGKPSAGFVNPLLYTNATAFHDIVKGNNDIDGTLRKYSARAGWDPCTGLGTPDGTKLMHALGG